MAVTKLQAEMLQRMLDSDEQPDCACRLMNYVNAVSSRDSRVLSGLASKGLFRFDTLAGSIKLRVRAHLHGGWYADA